MATSEDNGNNADERNWSTLLLKLDRRNFTLEIGGHTENFDEALAMLDIARRIIEGKIRAAQVAQTLSAPQGVRTFDVHRRH